MSLRKPSKRRILKNVGVLSAGCCILFTSYDGLASLQSTVNSEHSVGVASQAVIYFCFALSALILPKLVITRLGVKVTLVLSMLTYVPYVASNFYPHWDVMIPTSVLIGLGASLLWGTQANYLNDLSLMYAELLLVSVSNENESGISDQPLSDEDEEVSVIFHRSVKGRGGYGSFSNEKDHDAKIKSCSRTVKDETAASPADGNSSSYQSENKYGCPRSRTSSLGAKGNVENRRSQSPQEIGDTGDVRTCDTTIDLNADDSNSDSRCSNPDECTKSEVELNTNTSTAISFINSGFESGNEIDRNSKHSIPALHSGKKSISKSFDSTRFLQNKRNSDAKPIVIQTEVIRNQKKTIASTTARFFGFHGMAFLTSVIWSNLLSYYLMKADTKPKDGNSTTSCACGAAFCDQRCNDQRSFTHLADETRYLLTGTCVGLGLVSILLVAIFLDPLDEATTKDDSSALRLLLATWDMAKTPDLLMLTPISLYIGMAQAFFQGDFTKAFVGCAWGTGNVGLASAVYGGACAVGSFAAGWAVRALGRAPVFVCAALLNAAACVMLLTWEPTRKDETSFFVASVMWGLYVGITFSQLRAFLGVLFKADEEAAFGTFHTWYSLGFFFTFSFSSLLCTGVKIWAMLAVSTLGFVGYLLAERKHKMEVVRTIDNKSSAVPQGSGQNMTVSIIVTPSSPDLGIEVRQRTSSASRSRTIDDIQ